MFEISNINGNYADFTIASRSIDCSSITKEEFINAVDADIKEAIATYNEISIPNQLKVNVEKHNKWYKTYFDKKMEEAKKYAENKWRTEKRRNKYYAETISKLEEENSKYVPSFEKLTFFDFNGNCNTTMGISCICIISVDKYTNETLGYCFDELLNTKYFRRAIGWKLMYTGNTDTYESGFRPSIKLIFDPETEKEVEAARKALVDDVRRFYANTTYFGD